MPRRKIIRTPEEEEQIKKIRLEKKMASQRERRNAQRQARALQNKRVIDLEEMHSIVVLDDADNIVNEHYIGSMDVLCIHCKARHFHSERVANKGDSFNDCCSHGEVILDPLPPLPSILQVLFDGSHENSKHFYDRIRYYNNSFSFASFNANLVDFSNRRPGPYCFKIHGQIYYQMNTALYPSSDDNPSYGQLFFIDSNEACQKRCENNSQLNRNLIHAIDNALRQCNVFAKSYAMMKDEIQSMTNHGAEPELQLLFTLKPGMDRNRFNFQKINEVAAVFSLTADGEIPESYVTIRNTSTKELQCISTLDPSVDPWIYPLFFPHGTKGWHKDLKCAYNENRKVSRNAHTKYRMAIRDNFNVIIMGRRLFQQWVVDNYVKIEKDKIDFCKFNQKKLRAESYQGLIDHMQKQANDTNGRIGKMIILPSSFIGSPRYMLQLYQDAMAIVRKFGKPDLFITMTCNPKWREIEENLLENQTASDRPDIVARVFHLKKNELIDQIVKKKLFGDVLAYVYTIEFQKRGLPHVHLLVTLTRNSKMTTPEIIDKYISAEIPDSSENEKLHNIVMKNMIHGPCGDWCMENGKCSKKFPKQFCDATKLNEAGNSTYRRINSGKTYQRLNNYTVDNRHVVPYSPHLLTLLNCHINVEIVNNVSAVKYLYKYIYKGHDAAAIRIVEPEDQPVINHDEIQSYIETRYVGPVEGCWRILNKPLQAKSHSITRLPVHLPNGQNIIIQDEDDEDGLQNALEKETMLTDYFELNRRDGDARSLSYAEIPNRYVFKKEKNSNTFRWQKRQSQFNTIGRMYAISPTQVELYHLRLLLTVVKGAESYDDLRTINGYHHDTFVATCLARGLIEDDDEWERALHEAQSWMMPHQLRRLFVRILIYCQPVHPEVLWETFKIAMSEDLSRKYGLNQAYIKAYNEINTMLAREGFSLSQYPSMPQTFEIDDGLNDLSPDHYKNMGNRQYDMLNIDQKKIIDTILESVFNNTGNNCSRCFYIDGPGGSGKTFVYTTLCYLLKSKSKKICTMAFTGIAATLLPNGKTVHKTFGMPVPLFNDSTSSIKNNTKESEYLRNVDVFIWDEAPMAPRYALELVDRTLRDIMNNNVPFGGKIIVLGGDFRQLLPVQVNATRQEVVNLSIKFSKLWQQFLKFSLFKNMRALPEETTFAKFVLAVGDGLMTDKEDNFELPEQLVASKHADIVKDIYGKVIRDQRYEDLAKIAILSARNVDVNNINEQVVELLDRTTEKIYNSIDSADHCDNGDINDIILPEYLNSLNPPSLPPYELQLRNNCIVMLIRNLSIEEGLCNGTRLQIIELGNNLLKCKILTGDKTGEIVFINRITIICENVYPFTFKRRQFPIKLAFAMTINKCQGQTFDKIGIDLRKDVFNHGQLYVAFSRVRSWQSLQVYLGNQRTRTVKNYVYKEIYTHN